MTSRDEIEGKWWEKWWSENWTWAALADKPIGVNGSTVHYGQHGDRSLQDYWRRDPETGSMRDDAALLAAGDLVWAPDAALWHRIHVPLRWPDGSAAKEGWDTQARAGLAAMVSVRLAAASPTQVDRQCHAEAADGRAQLQGAVLLDAPTLAGDAIPPLVADWAVIPSWVAGQASVADGFRLDCSRLNAVDFGGATFTGCASFNRASFLDHVSFASVTFFGDAHFQVASFSRNANFTGTTFSGDAAFNDVSFLSDTFFHKALFSSRATFLFGTFSGYAGFLGTKFCGDAAFMMAVFSRDASFGATGFSGDANFTRATFSGDARFHHASFSNRLNFAAARFQGPVAFQSVRAWPVNAEHWHRAFLGTEFAQTPTFEASGLRSFAAFDGVRIAPDASLLLDDPSETEAKRTFQSELRAAREAGRRDAEGGTMSAGTTVDPDQLKQQLQVRLTSRLRRAREREKIDERLKQLERGCRALVVEMEKLRDRSRAQLLYRFEITARRHQHETATWEKIASWLYEKLGDYGLSIARPLFALLFSIPLMAFLYGGFLAWQHPALCTNGPQRACERYEVDLNRSVEPLFFWSLAFSASRALPFDTFNVNADEPERGAPVRVLLVGEADTWQHVLIRLTATFHSIFALGMAFLSGLAIRRRFQID